MSVSATPDPMGLDLHTLLGRGLGPAPLVAVILRDSPTAVDNTRRLLRLTPAARIVIIDDGTSDPSAVGVLACCDLVGGVTVVRHDAPVGHAACAARAAELAGEADLVVVDCDVEVGPGWLTGLRRVARAGIGVAAVGARRHTGGVTGPSHLTWSEIARAADRAPIPAATAVDEIVRGAVLFSAAGLRAWRASGAGGLDLPAFCATATGAGLSLLVAGRVLVRAPSGPAAGRRTAPDADLRSMRSVPPRIAYVVRGGDPFASPDPTHEAARRLGYVQESLRFDLNGADRFGVTRLGTTGDELLVEQTGPVTAEKLAAALIDLGVELLHVADDAEGPLELILDIAGRIGVPRVLTASVERAAAVGSPLCEVVIALSARAARAHPGARILSPGVRIPGPHPSTRRGRGRKVGPIRVLADSHDAQDIGALVVQIAAQVGPLVEFHLLGPTTAETGSSVVAHGAHPAHRTWRVLRDIDPDLALVVPNGHSAFDPGAARYRALGVPAVVVGEGSAADEVRVRGGGVVVDSGKPADAAEMLTRLARDRARLTSLHADLTPEPLLTDLPFVEGIRGCYDALLHRPGHRQRLGYLLLGEFARQDGSAQIRVLTWLASATEFVAARQVFLDEILHRDALREFDTLLVQRRFLGADAEPLLAAVRASGIRMVVDLDDDILDEGAAARSGGMDLRTHQRVRRELTSRIRSAHTVVVSTPTLAERIGPLSPRPPTVAANHLDPRSWLSEVPTRRSPHRDFVRLLYMGTKTHLDDLMLLRGVLDRVSDAIGTPVALEVVGVAEKFDGDEWITRLPVPRRAQSYPEFVPWLRVRRARWDAAVAPLADCHFNQAKSDLKLLEYAMLGLPVVASDVGPYRGGEHLARLTANAPASWIAALTQMLGDLPAAQDRAAAARAHVEAHRMITQDKALEWLRLVMGDAAGADCRYGGRHSPAGDLEGGRT